MIETDVHFSKTKKLCISLLSNKAQVIRANASQLKSKASVLISWKSKYCKANISVLESQLFLTKMISLDFLRSICTFIVTNTVELQGYISKTAIVKAIKCTGNCAKMNKDW